MRHPALRNSARICGNKKNPVERLVCSGRGPAIPGASVNIIEPHKIKVIWRGEEERAAGAGDARHFTQRCRGIRQMFDGFAGDDDVEGAGGVRQILRVSLRKLQANAGPRFRAGGVSARDLQRGAGEIRAEHPGATRSQEAGKASATASHFQNAQALDGRQIFAHQLVPRAVCVLAFRRGVGNFLVPIVVLSREAHPSALSY